MNFIISDQHYFHYNIIRYCDRPFLNIQTMNEYMTEQWNSVVKPDDTVINLGDVGFGKFDQLNSIIKQLNGYKILILGNHDKRAGGISFWERIGFNEVYKKPIILDENIILSHEPIIDEDIMKNFKFNYHGHLHNNSSMNNDKYKNFSVELINYTPVPIQYSTITKPI